MRVEARTTGWLAWAFPAGLLWLAVLGGVADAARAHPGHRGSERVLKLDLSGAEPRFSYALVLAPDQASSLRAQADADRDGQVSDAEQEAAMGRLTSAFLGAVTLCRGPVLERLTCGPASAGSQPVREAEGWDAGADVALALSWQLPLALAANEGAVRVEENFAREHVARTAAVIEPPAQYPLTRAGSGAAAAQGGVELEFSWEEEGRVDAPRVLFAEWRAPAAAWAAWGMALGTLLLAGGMAFWALRLRPAASREAKPSA